MNGTICTMAMSEFLNLNAASVLFLSLFTSLSTCANSVAMS